MCSGEGEMALLAILVGKIRNIIANYGYEAKKLTNKFTVQKIGVCDNEKLACNTISQQKPFHRDALNQRAVLEIIFIIIKQWRR